jgi:hypothetical protein
LAATRGAQNKWKLVQLAGQKGAKGNAIEVLENAEGVFTKDDKTGAIRRLTPEERMAAGGGGGGPTMGRNEAFFREGLAGSSKAEDPAALTKYISEGLPRAQQMDAMESAVQEIRAGAPGGVLSFEYAAELMKNGATPEMLQAAGFHPDTIPAAPAIRR